MQFSSLAEEIKRKKAIAKALRGESKGRGTYATKELIRAKEEELGSAVQISKQGDSLKRKREDVEQNSEAIEQEKKRAIILKELADEKVKLQREDDDLLASKVTKEEVKILESLTDEELEKRLSNCGAVPFVSEEETKIERIRRLQAQEEAVKQKQAKLEQARLEDEIDYHIIAEDIRDNQDKVYIQMRSYLKFLLKTWEASVELENKQQVQLLLQTKKDIVPLLVKLRQKSLSEDVFASLSTTLKYLQDKNYLMSNDSYLKLSIGNACWPIGVISIGIHARSAHSRLTGQAKKSNIMTDEKTRKWLMSIKRLITFAEKKWPS